MESDQTDAKHLVGVAHGHLDKVREIIMRNCIGAEATMDALDLIEDTFSSVRFALENHRILSVPPEEPFKN